MSEKLIFKFFQKEFDKLFDEGKEILVRECKKSALLSLLNEYKIYFPISVVSYNSEYYPAYFIGNFNAECFYYSYEHNLIYIAKENDNCPCEVEKANEIDILWEIIFILENLEMFGCFDDGQTKKFLVPEGFYLFKYKIRCVSNANDVIKQVMSVKKAKYVDEAIKKFDNEFCLNPGNCFMDFEIYANSKWRKLNKTNCAILFSFNFHQAEFILE